MDPFWSPEFPVFACPGHVLCRDGLHQRRRRMDWDTMWAWVYTPWLTVGNTDITLARVAGLFFILAFAWWFSSMLETGLRRVALHGRHHATRSTVYAFTRLVRYVVWIVGTLIGLNYLGFNLASLAFL